jgi:phosphohistidine phosphatase
MLVYFLRHASAGQSSADPKKDERRPLDAEGIRQCGYIGRTLAAMEIHADAIVSSPLKRAMQTASLVGTEMGYEAKILLEDGLRPDADFESFREIVRRNSHLDSIVVVGHNPSITEFLATFISSRGGRSGIELKKGAIARVQTNPKQNTLQWCITPKIAMSIYESVTSKSRPKTSRK